MRPLTTLGQALGWVALRAFWVAVSRNNHPNLRLNAIVSLLLVATFAAAVYANHLWLIPGLWRGRKYAAYAAALLLAMGLLALACTVAIQVVYDVLWGPDPARFGFRANIGMESGLVALHVLGVAVGVRIFRPIAGSLSRQSSRSRSRLRK